MIAGVVLGQEVVGACGIPEGGVEVDAAVDEVGGADEVVVGVAHLLTEGGRNPNPKPHKRPKSSYPQKQHNTAIEFLLFLGSHP